MKSFIILLSITMFFGCTKKFEDSDIILTSKSMFGASVHIATFNGNSAYKQQDCQAIADTLKKEYGNPTYQCLYYGSIKDNLEQ